MSKRIGEILLDEGTITEGQLRKALEMQASSGGARWLGAILVEMGALNDEAIARGLSIQNGYPYVNPARHPVDPALIWKIPRELAERHQLIPLDRDGPDGEGPVRVAMADPKNFSAVQDIEFLLRGPIKPMVASATTIRQAIHRHYDMAPDARRLLAGVDDSLRAPTTAPTSLDLDVTTIKSQLRAGGMKPYINLLNYLMLNAIERGASDIHLEPGQDAVRVRFRIDGMLREVLTLPRWAEAPLVTRIKVVGELDVSMHKKPQDGKVSVSLGEKRIDMRISIVPSQFGENVVIRLLDPVMLLTDLGIMGWQPRALSSYYRMVSMPQGLVLVVGPTGSGKSTTLYGSISRLRAENTSIVTIEDPIEYTVQGVTQINVDRRNDMTFAKSVRSLLRQDPNVIVIGEIRDLETGQASMEAANTGHLVLSTLHTSQTVNTINRLLELGLPPYLVGSSLVGIVAQRLLRRVCQECSHIGPVEVEDWHRLGVKPVDLGEAVRSPGPGCPRCQYAGYTGRVGTFEVLQISEDLKSGILGKASEVELWRIARQEGLTTLLDDALFKVHQGVSTMEEVARAIPIDPWRRPDAQEPAVMRGDDYASALQAEAAPWRPLWATDDINTAITGMYQMSGDKEGQTRLHVSVGDREPAWQPSADTDQGERAAAKRDAADPAVDTDQGDDAKQPAAEAATAKPVVTIETQESIEPPSLPMPEPIADDDAESEGRDTILIVDDADEILQLVSLTLEDTYDVVTAMDGFEGLRQADEHSPALIVLDVMMPKMSGYDVCLRIKENPRTEHIPVLMLSARGEKQAVAKGFYAGADDYLPKPFDPEELLLRIRALIRRSKRAARRAAKSDE